MRHTNFLSAASQPRTAAGGYLGSPGAQGEPAVPLPSCAGRTEPRPTNIYAATKLAQEHMLAAWTAAHDTTLSVLRLQNVYGPGQSLTNSYTGIVTLFARLAREQRPLEVYEDGRIVRDFVFIDDVVDALSAAVQRPATEPRCLDIGSGIATTIHELARKIATVCDAPEPIVVPKFRDGDVRAASCTSSRRRTSSAGVRTGCSRTVCMHCSTGSASSPNCLSEPSDHTHVPGRPW